MRRVNVALFLITLAIVLFSLFRSALVGPAGTAQAFARRAPAALPPQALLAGKSHNLSVDCYLPPDLIGSMAWSPHGAGSKLPAKATVYPED